MATKTIDELLQQAKDIRLEIAKQQQPILGEIVDTLRGEAMTDALGVLRTAGDKLASSSTVSVQITNLINAYSNLSTAVAREAVQVAQSVGPAGTTGE